MRIGMLSKFPPEQDGIAIYAQSLVNKMRGVTVVRIGDRGSEAEHIVDFRALSLRRKLLEIVERERLDVLHVQYVATYFGKRFLNLNLLFALRLPIPVVVTLHEVHYTSTTARDILLSFLERAILRRSKVMVHTPEQQRFLRLKTGITPFQIYHGLTPYPIKTPAKNTLLLFGMLTPLKGAEILIRAMKFLPGYHLIIAGKPSTPEYGRRLQALAHAMPKNIHVRLGWISEKEKRSLYERSALVILPYLWSPYQSGILHNAFSYGRPTVSTSVGSLSEVATSFGSGEIVRPCDPGALARAIRKATIRYRSYRKGIERYRRVASWKNVAKEHVKLYAQMRKR